MCANWWNPRSFAYFCLQKWVGRQPLQVANETTTGDKLLLTIACIYTNIFCSCVSNLNCGGADEKTWNWGVGCDRGSTCPDLTVLRRWLVVLAGYLRVRRQCRRGRREAGLFRGRGQRQGRVLRQFLGRRMR